MTTTTKNAPTAALLGQARSGLGLALLGVSAVVLLWGGAALGSRLVPLPEPVVVELEWSYVGAGDDVSTVFDVAAAGTFTVEWFSPCGADLSLNEWTGAEVVQRVPLGDSDDAQAAVTLTPGTWYAAVHSECRWGVRVSST